MPISAMYPAKAGSPKTALAADITSAATSMTVSDSSVLPTGPNLCVVGDDSSAEVIYYESMNGNTLNGLIRGVPGSGTMAKAWTSGTSVSRNFTSFDHNRFKDNIETLENEKAAANSVYTKDDVYTKAEADTLLNGKSPSDHIHDGRYYTEEEIDEALTLKANADSPTFTGTPRSVTPASGDNSTMVATTEFVQTGLAGKQNSLTLPLPTTQGGTGNTNGTVAKLTTARTIRTNLASAAVASFDGSANVTPGVNGILGTANGGTGGSDSGWQTLTNSSVFSGTIKYRKIGNFVILYLYSVNLKSALSKGDNVDLGTIASGYRPAANTEATIASVGSGASGAMLSIRSNGKLGLYPAPGLGISKSVNIHMTCMYLLG